MSNAREAAPQPFGYDAYCGGDAATVGAAERHFREAFCRSNAPPTVVQLTAERVDELNRVQQRVNAAISYGGTTTWDPLMMQGDCKTYAARKALELLERGWPASALRIATAFIDDGSSQQNSYHAVLLVDTDRGTMVLDSRYPTLRPWDELSYRWMTTQARGLGDKWVWLAADPGKVKIAMAPSTGDSAHPATDH
jgi:predicted transglutaminase-like cysteine proteinase